MAKLSPVRCSAILESVRRGNYFRHAVEAAGVHYTTAYEWLNRGNELIAQARLEDPDIEQTLADWLGDHPDDFEPDNPMWSASPPPPFFWPDWLYVLFAIAHRKAKAKAIADAVRGIRKAGKDSWQAYAWWLERTEPELFGKRQTIQHAGADGGPVEVAEVSSEHLLARIAELKAKRDGQR